MATESPLQAETALAELAEQFEDWRRSRTTGQERIPPSLWDQAVALSTVLPCSRVARRLRVRSTDLRKRGAGGAGGGRDRSRRTDPGLCRSDRALAGVGGAGRRPDRGRAPGRGAAAAAVPGRAAAGDRAARLSGAGVMLQLTPQSRILLALAPVDFRNGIDGLAAVCRRHFARNPLDGAVYVFRNRAGTTLKLLCYDGQGFWLCTKRWSQGRLQWWPRADGAAVSLVARELQVLLWNGCPDRAAMTADWRPVA